VSKKLIVLAGAGLAALGIAAVAQAAILQTFVGSVSPAKAGKGVGYKVEYGTTLSAEEPGYKVKGQPPPPTNLTIRTPKGMKFGAKYFARCTLAKLQSQGPKGCPGKSKIGSGQGRGSARPIVTQDVNAKLTIFNGQKMGGKDTIFVFVLPDLGPTFVVVGKVNPGTGGFGYDLDFTIPPIKTLPSAPDAAVISVKTNVPRKTVKKGGKKRFLVTAPKKCKGSWPFEGEFNFADGRSATVSVKQKCKK
jgi:hypothetical protein